MANAHLYPETFPEDLGFREELRLQRWDDHRYYHQSRINQSLHLFSAFCFLCAYITIFFSATAAAMIGWLLAMVSRQAGHFFFEPRDYDRINDATHNHKEDIKVGYNLSRKRVLHAVWILIPIMLAFSPSMFGLFERRHSLEDYFYNLSIMWIGLGVFALMFRMIQLFVQHNVQTGLVWVTKILTDPFNDVKTYLKAPVYLMRGELLDPMDHVQHGGSH